MFTMDGAKEIGKLLFDGNLLGLLDADGDEITTQTWESYTRIPMEVVTDQNEEEKAEEKGMKCYIKLSSSANDTVTAKNINVFYFFDTEPDQSAFTVYGISIMHKNGSNIDVYYKGELDSPITLQPNQRPRFQKESLSFTINFQETTP